MPENYTTSTPEDAAWALRQLARPCSSCGAKPGSPCVVMPSTDMADFVSTYRAAGVYPVGLFHAGRKPAYVRK